MTSVAIFLSLLLCFSLGYHVKTSVTRTYHTTDSMIIDAVGSIALILLSVIALYWSME
jgi:hypothetical protein